MNIPHILFFILSGIGILETIYLIHSRIQENRPKCILGSNECHLVLESKYNKTFGVHNDILGLLFYISSSILAALVIMETAPFQLWHISSKVLILTGLLLSAYFTYLQWRVIKKMVFLVPNVSSNDNHHGSDTHSF